MAGRRWLVAGPDQVGAGHALRATRNPIRRAAFGLVLCWLGVFAASPAKAQLIIERTVTVGQNVPDYGTHVSTLVWENAGLTSITDVNVQLHLTSASGMTMRLGQMYASLTHGTASENERVAVLINRPGVSSSSAFGSSLQSLNITLDDAAAVNVYQLTNSTGTYAADGRIGVDPFGTRVAYSTNQITAGLGALNGGWLESNTWSLLVADAQGGNQAKLESWKLTVEGAAVNSGTFRPGPNGRLAVSAGESTANVGAAVELESGSKVTAEAGAGKTLRLEGGLTGAGDLETSTEAGGKVVVGGNSADFAGVLKVAGTGTTELTDTRALGRGTLRQTNGNSVVRLNFTGTLTNALDVYKLSFATNGATLAGQVKVNNAEFDVAAGNTNTVTGEITGSAGVTKTGLGTLVLGGSTTNTFTGASAVATNGGTLVLNKTAGTTAISGSSIAIHSGGTLLLGAANQIGNNTQVTMAGGTLALGGFHETAGRLAVTADSIFDFGTAEGGTNTFTFADFDTAGYGGVAGLTFSNVGIGSKVVFNTDYSGGGSTTFNTFAAKISFSDANLQSQISFGGGTTTLTVAAIPDARVAWAAGVLCGLIGLVELRRRQSDGESRRCEAGRAGSMTPPAC